MLLIVGLGNPGKKYQYTRHNIGFRVVEELIDCFGFDDLGFKKIFNAQISYSQKIILAKPETFMNLSGKAVLKITHFYDIKSQNIIVIHDDIDLPLGKIRIVKNRGAGGHKGIESIIKELKTKNFIRLRIGIGQENIKNKNTEKFVLLNFGKKEEKVIEKNIKKGAKAIKFLTENSFEKAQNKYNTDS